MNRRAIAAAVLAVAALLHGGVAAIAADAARVIKISAKRYEYTPKEITLKKGQPVVLQLTTEDRSHGFSIPALNLRADIVRNKVTELKFTPQNTGDLTFYCDIFCGNGHDDMSGKFKVTD
jgi:cytochrome c oxidase subunit 2